MLLQDALLAHLKVYERIKQPYNVRIWFFYIESFWCDLDIGNFVSKILR
jgi:hypothetical protein